jgi:hypothetical protein
VRGVISVLCRDFVNTEALCLQYLEVIKEKDKVSPEILLSNVSFVKVDRSQNRVSHYLANFARTESRTMVWIGSGPDCLAQALVYDQDVIPAA